MHDWTALYVVAVVFLATLIRSTFGFGEALVAVPLLALRLPISVAAPLAVLISVLVAATIVAQDWRHIDVRSAGGLIAAALLGVPFGLLLLVRADERTTRVVLGLVIVAFSVYSLTARRGPHLVSDHPLWLTLAGFASGVLGGAYGMNGPPLAIYGSLRRWSPQRFRATLQGYFLPVSLAGLVGYAIVGVWDRDVTRYLLLSLPGAAVATIAGRHLNRRLSGDRFFRFVYVGLIVVGLVLLAQ